MTDLKDDSKKQILQKKESDTKRHAKARKKKLAVAKKKIQRQTEKVEAEDKVLKALEKGGVLETEDLKKSSKSVRKTLESSTAKAGWTPNPGVQYEFLQATEMEVLFSGGRGSGKSDALLMDIVRYVHNGNFRGLIIRKSMRQFRNLIKRAKFLFNSCIPGMGKKNWRSVDKMFVFPSGATLEFCYCECEDDLDQYIGQEYTWLGIDELTLYDGDWIIEKLRISLRTTDPTLPVQLRYTTNPYGVGKRWVKKRFIDLAPEGKSIVIRKTVMLRGKEKVLETTRKWFNSTVDDNPTLLHDDTYLAALENISNPSLYKQWRWGSWDGNEGCAFPEFDKVVHTCKPFKIPRHWKKWRAMDWGFSATPYAVVCLWLAKDPKTKTVYVYREYTDRLKTADLVAQKVLDIQMSNNYENVPYGYLDRSVWSKRGEVGDTPADTMMKMGLCWTPADASPGRRAKDKILVHQYLQPDEDGKSKLVIVDSCKNLIEEMETIPEDEKKVDDVDTTAVDHAYDTLRYGLQDHPLTEGILGSQLADSEYEPVSDAFGF